MSKPKFPVTCDECKKKFTVDEKPVAGLAHICGECSAPDYSSKCENCGATPVVPQSGMCGPCTFGEADTAGGDW
jgi:hypothetical protein